MANKKIELSAFHEVPKEIEKILLLNKDLLEKWNLLSSLARNEWICWAIIMPKKEETKLEHLKRLEEDILNGKKRPCCWPGCPHRRESAKKWFK
ncbi:MAG: YdeI/OmpD-associated family protein [Nanoarchaeota archaeon]|nr:YdeI/OmpD-associated family protein [Nanoarchaeota archaeon]